MADIQLKKVDKAFGATEVLKQIDLDINDGEFVVFVGPSGCGKSTLLRIIAGLDEITAGSLLIDGQEVNQLPPAKRGIAMVFQSYALYPHMSVYQNMAFGLKLAKVPKQEIDTRVRSTAELLHISHLLFRKPKQLSGGQRQRVAIGRAIVREPKVFLFDEPLSNLDASLRVHMRYEFAKLHENLAATMVYVTHDQVEAMTLADKIVVLSEGKIEQVGSPMELYRYPVNTFVAGFIGSPKMNFIPVTLLQADSSTTRVRLNSGVELTVSIDTSRAQVGDKLTLGIRPEHLSINRPAANTFGAKVQFVESLGSNTVAYIAVEGLDEPLVVQQPGIVSLMQDEALQVGVAVDQCYLFDADSAAYTPAL